VTQLKIGLRPRVHDGAGPYRSAGGVDRLGVDPKRVYVDHGMTGATRARPDRHGHGTHPGRHQVSPTGPIGIDRPPTGTADSVLLTRTIDQGGGLGLWSTNPGGTTLSDVCGPAFYDQAFRVSDITVVYTGSGATLTRHSYIANDEGGGVLVNPAPVQ